MLLIVIGNDTGTITRVALNRKQIVFTFRARFQIVHPRIEWDHSKLTAPAKSSSVTCVYICVVATLECPNRVCTARRS